MSKRRKPINSSLASNDLEKQEKLIEKLKQNDDKPIEEEKGTVRITIDIPKPFHKKIKAYTKSRGQTIKGYLLWLAAQDIEGQ